MNLTIQYSHKGFTLLEVMIALVIFSIGLIGLAGLQAISLQNNQVAYSRTVATTLVYDIADRIRNNKTQNYTTAIPGSPPAQDCIGAAATCTPAQLLAHDLYYWDQAVKNSNTNLLNAQGYITRTGTTYTIAIGWDENRLGLSPPYNCTAVTPTPAGVECVKILVEP